MNYTQNEVVSAATRKLARETGRIASAAERESDMFDRIATSFERIATALEQAVARVDLIMAALADSQKEQPEPELRGSPVIADGDPWRGIPVDQRFRFVGMAGYPDKI